MMIGTALMRNVERMKTNNMAYIDKAKTDEWETPQYLFDQLNDEFHFTIDVCSTDENAKCEKHYTKQDDGLSKDWTGEVVWCNPPYGRQMPLWVHKCYQHFIGGGYCGHADSIQDRYESISRMDPSICGNQIHQRQS